jgi:hypothetical protein
MAVSITQAVGSGILVADDIYGRLAVGGIGIAVGSVLAVVVLGFIVRNNRENVCRGDTQGFRRPTNYDYSAAVNALLNLY